MDSPEMYDCIVIGGGPAGYSAALYAVRASLQTLVLEQGMAGGQIATTDVVDNYPGIPEVTGAELGSKMQAHAEAAGAESAYGMVTDLQRLPDGTFSIATDTQSFQARSVIVTTGATP